MSKSALLTSEFDSEHSLFLPLPLVEQEESKEPVANPDFKINQPAKLRLKRVNKRRISAPLPSLESFWDPCRMQPLRNEVVPIQREEESIYEVEELHYLDRIMSDNLDDRNQIFPHRDYLFSNSEIDIARVIDSEIISQSYSSDAISDSIDEFSESELFDRLLAECDDAINAYEGPREQSGSDKDLPDRISIHFSEGVTVNNENENFASASLPGDEVNIFKVLTAEQQAKVRNKPHKRRHNSLSVPTAPSSHGDG